MSEIEVRRDTPPALPESSLVTWAQEASAAYRVAQSLVKTPFCPSSLSDPAAAAAAILAGKEVGLMPMSALRSIDIIQNVPAMRAVAMRALVQGAGHEVWVVEQTETRAVVCGQRRGSDKVNKSTWTIERARQLNLTNKPNWKSQPGAMLVARATSEACRLTAADVILGLAYSAEELADGNEDAPAPPVRRTAKRKPVEPMPAEAEPDLPAPPADEPEPEPVVEELPEVPGWET